MGQDLKAQLDPAWTAWWSELQRIFALCGYGDDQNGADWRHHYEAGRTPAQALAADHPRGKPLTTCQTHKRGFHEASVTPHPDSQEAQRRATLAVAPDDDGWHVEEDSVPVTERGLSYGNACLAMRCIRDRSLKSK